MPTSQSSTSQSSLAHSDKTRQQDLSDREKNRSHQYHSQPWTSRHDSKPLQQRQSNTPSRSRREIIAFEGFMFDTKVLRDTDDESKLQANRLLESTTSVGATKAHEYRNTVQALATTDIKIANEITRRGATVEGTPLFSDQPEKTDEGSTPKKKTLSTSSISSTSSMNSASTASSSSSTTPSSIAPLSPEEVPSAFSIVKGSVLGEGNISPSSPTPSIKATATTSITELTVAGMSPNEHQGDISAVEIETENPSHLFWVPFHMHPEIAPNEYNMWLEKHGADARGNRGPFDARKTSINRRKSVLSAQYSPEDDVEDSVDKTKGADTSMDRSADTTKSIAVEDLTTAKRGSGLTRHGPSLLRRSARIKVRRNSISSGSDASRIRTAPVENGEYPAITLVDPGPTQRPLSDSAVTSITIDAITAATVKEVALATVTATTTEATTLATSVPAAQTAAALSDMQRSDSRRQLGMDSKPLKRFVSTLRDPSKPTITTYVEPQLLEQRQKEMEGASGPTGDGPAVGNTTPTTVTTSTSQGCILPQEPSEPLTLESIVSKVTYPIPPPVKLTQNLLQTPASQALVTKQVSPPTALQVIVGRKQQGSVGTLPPPIPPHPKKSSWSWFWTKEKASEKNANASQQQKAPTHAHANREVSSEVSLKKQSTLSQLFSRNSKTSSKVQSTSPEIDTSASAGGVAGQLVQDDALHDPSRMPIHIERAVYRMSHVKLANPRRPLHEQVLISNMMFWYLGIVQQQMESQQQQQQQLQSHDQQLEDEQSPSHLQQHTTLDSESLPIKSNQQQDVQEDKIQSLSISDTRVAGHEHVVPQQDSNSHARFPSKEIVYGQMFEDRFAQNSSGYDEESLIGGGLNEEFDWSDDEADVDMEAGAGSLYLQGDVQVPSSCSETLSQDRTTLVHISEARHPGVLSAS